MRTQAIVPHHSSHPASHPTVPHLFHSVKDCRLQLVQHFLPRHRVKIIVVGAAAARQRLLVLERLEMSGEGGRGGGGWKSHASRGWVDAHHRGGVRTQWEQGLVSSLLYLVSQLSEEHRHVIERPKTLDDNFLGVGDS